MRFIATLVVVLGVAAPLKAQPPTEQTKRGQELFLKSPKGTACGTCHELGGQGTAVGPNLKNIASYAMPRGMVMAIRMSSTETVQLVTPANATKPFPARIIEKKDGNYSMWNLSTTPPAMLTMSEKDVATLARDQSWAHPPAGAGYTASELADIVGFIRWAATGNTKVVTVDEVGSSQ